MLIVFRLRKISLLKNEAVTCIPISTVSQKRRGCKSSLYVRQSNTSSVVTPTGKKQNVKRANKFSTPGPMTDSQVISQEKMPLVSIIDDTPKSKDSMPDTSKKWRNTDLKSQDLQLKKDRPRTSYLKIVTLNINAIRNKKEKIRAK